MNSKRLVRLCGYGTALMLLYIGIVISTSWAQSSTPQPPYSSFQIPAQPLPSALLRYTEQSGVHVTSSAGLVEHKHTRGIVGQFDVRTALAKILQGTALGFEMIDDRTAVILPERATLNPRPNEKRAVHIRDQGTTPAEAEVVVTGSHIRRFRGNPSLVFTFDRDDFARAGSSSLQEFMRTLPQNFPGGRTEASGALMSWRNGGRDNLTQGAGVNIRGLGNESTLVLINGRRLASGGFGTFFDVSTLPLSAIERIEVLADGTSAVYGSDAVGGVVNFILRDNLDGAETSLRYGTVTDGDLSEFTANQLLGMSWSQGSLLVNFDYGERDALHAAERDYAKGLWGGKNLLLPQEKRLSALIRAKQALSNSLSLALDVLATDRDAQNDMYQSITDNQIHSLSETEQLSGIAELTWQASNGWEIAIAHTDSQSDSFRLNDIGYPRRQTAVKAELGLTVSDIKVHGTTFRAPGGLSQLAIGVEQRHETFDSERFNTAGLPRSSLERRVDAAYAELYIPLAATDVTEHRTLLELTGAVRYEDFSDYGTTDNVKIVTTWSPHSSLDVHATWGTSFRAPALFLYDDSLSGGGVFYVPNPASPTGKTLAAFAGQAPRPDLGPERATTWTAGISINSPGDMRLSAAYFHIDYNNRIVTPIVGLNAFLDPAQRPLISMPPDAEVLEFVRTAQQYANTTTRNLADVEATVDGRTNNQAEATVSGIDLTLSNEIATAAGVWAFSLNANYFLEFDTRGNNSSPSRNILNTLSNPVDLRGRGQLTWSNGNWSISGAVNYVDDYVDNQLPELRGISSWTTIDLGASYEFRNASGWLRNMAARVNITNAADKAPPRVIDRGGSYGDVGYDTENANPLGRFISFQISKAWQK